MGLELSKVTNANVFVDGANHLGKASEITLPEIKRKMVDHDALGIASDLELPSRGVEKMESRFKWTSFFNDVYRKVANPNKVSRVQVRASIDKYTGDGLSAEVPLIISLAGIWKTNPLGSIKKGEGMMSETVMTVYYLKVVADGEVLQELDVMNNIDQVAGVDVLSRYRSLLGA